MGICVELSKMVYLKLEVIQRLPDLVHLGFFNLINYEGTIQKTFSLENCMINGFSRQNRHRHQIFLDLISDLDFLVTWTNHLGIRILVWIAKEFLYPFNCPQISVLTNFMVKYKFCPMCLNESALQLIHFYSLLCLHQALVCLFLKKQAGSSDCPSRKFCLPPLQAAVAAGSKYRVMRLHIVLQQGFRHVYL